MVGVIKNIFVDNWDELEQLNSGNIRSVVYREIKKMLNCGSLDVGYIEFKCGACDATMMPKEPEKLMLKEADFDEVFQEFKNKKF